MSNPPPRPPRLVAETAIEKGETEEMVFRADEFDEFGQHFKRRLAGAAKTDEISGRSTLLEIRSYFVVQRTLTEYSQEDT
jgi:transcription initiation factor TFIID subunit TAF12